MSVFLKRLKSKSELRERPFRSNVPVFGGLIAGFRRLWNDVSTRWYVLPLAQQQSEFNAVLIEGLQAQFAEIDQRLIDLDRDQTALMRTLAEVQYHVIQLRRDLEAQQRTDGVDAEEA